MRLFTLPLLCCFTTLFLVTSCSSKFDVTTSEIFRTNILEDDAKMFTYTMVFVNHDTHDKAGGEAHKVERNKKGERRNKGEGRSSRGDKQGNRKSGNTGDKSNASDKQSQLAKHLRTLLETGLLEKLKETGYCRKGHFELDRILNKTIYTIKGECSESATDKDRQKFINK